MFGDFLEELKQKEIEISFSDEKILYSGPEENITPELIGKLKEFKDDLMKYFWPTECKNLIPVNYNGSKIPLIFIECLDLSRLLSNYFGSDQPIYTFQNNVLSTGEKIPHNSVESFVKDYINQLKKVLPNGPYFLAGYSFGGTLAYEMAIQLQKSSNEVPFITLFDTMSPYPYELFNWHNNIITMLIFFLRMNINKVKQFIKMSVFNSFFLIWKSIHEPLRENYIITKFHMLTYKYQPEKLNANIVLFKVNKSYPHEKYDYGWKTFVDKIKIVELKGNHGSILREIENVEIIGREIEKHLADFRKRK